jgi:PhnB protein
MAKVRAVPEGHHTVTPYLVIKGAAEAIEFYKKAFGAKEINRMPGPTGAVMHAELKIGDSMVYLSEEFPGMTKSPKTLGGSPVGIHIYTENVDAAFNKAVAAGATVKNALMDMFWGDRFGKLTDPYGHEWSLAEHKEDVAPEEMKKRAEAFNKQMAQQMGKPKG